MPTKLKFAVFLLVFLSLGSTVYFAGASQVWRGWWKKQTAPDSTAGTKKPVVSKPEHPGRLVEAGNTEEENLHFTFFDVLDDPGMVRYVDLNGRVVQLAEASGRKPPSPVLASKPLPTKRNPVVTPEAAPSRPVTRKTFSRNSAPVSRPKPGPSVQAPVPARPIDRDRKTVRVPPPETRTPAVSSQEDKSPSALELLEALEAPARPGSGEKPFWVQAGSFRDRRRAEILRGFLEKKGYPAWVEPAEIAGKGTWYRVYLGKFAGRQEAERVIRRARKEHGLTPVLKERAG